MATDQRFGFLEAGTRLLLEREILPVYLPRCRWFAGKSRSLAQVRILDEIAAPDSNEWTVFLIQAQYSQGPSETYLLPLARASASAAMDLRAEGSQAIVVDSAEAGVLYEAFHHSGFRSRVLGLIAREKSGQGQVARIRAAVRKAARRGAAH